MPITLKCPHDNAELEFVPDERTGGFLKCPKCGCIFRVCLATFNRECFAKIHPKTEWKSDKKKTEMDIQMDYPAIPEKRKRGRPPKNVEKVEEDAS